MSDDNKYVIELFEDSTGRIVSTVNGVFTSQTVARQFDALFRCPGLTWHIREVSEKIPKQD